MLLRVHCKGHYYFIKSEIFCPDFGNCFPGFYEKNVAIVIEHELPCDLSVLLLLYTAKIVLCTQRIC